MATLAVEQPDVLSFETTVERVEQSEDGAAVVLDDRYFSPEGDGQPSDRGTVAGHPVAHVRKDPVLL